MTIDDYSETPTMAQTTVEQRIHVIGLPRFELGTFGPPDHRNLSRTSVWTASSRGFNDVCLTGLTGISVSV